MSNVVTNKEIYEAIDSLRQELGHRMDKIESEVDCNTNWRNRITGQFAVMMIFIGLTINFIWDSFVEKFER